MKEAAGEANITVITIVLIAIVLAVGTVIINQVMTGTSKKAACTAIGGSYEKGLCNVKDAGYDGQGNAIQAGVKAPTKCPSGYENGYYYFSIKECKAK